VVGRIGVDAAIAAGVEADAVWVPGAGPVAMVGRALSGSVVGVSVFGAGSEAIFVGAQAASGSEAVGVEVRIGTGSEVVGVGFLGSGSVVISRHGGALGRLSMVPGGGVPRSLAGSTPSGGATVMFAVGGGPGGHWHGHPGRWVLGG